MKLFKNKTKEEPEIQENAVQPVQMEPAEKSDLVLNIEGGTEAAPKLELPDLKAETKALPDSEEVFLGELRTILEGNPQEDAPDEEALSLGSSVLTEDATAQKEAPQEPAPAEDKAADEAEVEDPAEAPAEKPLASMSYESMAEAVKTAQKEPTGRFSREAVDDETFLAELYTLIGDGSRGKTAKTDSYHSPAGERLTPQARPTVELNDEQLKDAPEEFEEVLEDDSTGVPGWLKGVFLLLISLLLSAMTFYAVASDVIGEIF